MRRMTNQMLRMASGSAIAALLAISGQASAQAAAEAENQGLEDIVVTAQRRSESIQNVPVAVTAFNTQELQRANIQDVGAYFQNTPNVFITDSPVRSGNNVSSSALGLALRGISNVGGNASSFGIYLDDFNISNIALNPHLIDMERIEVLRGPQGTYFGRNASGGVMSLNTAKPDTRGFAGEVNAMAGRFGSYELGGMVNVPLNDMVAIRAAGKWETSNGEFNNKAPIGGGNGRDYKAARLSLRATPTEQLTIDLSYNYTREKDDDFGLIHTGVLSDFIKSICPGVTFSCPVDSNLGFYPNNRRNYAHDAPLVVDNEYHIAVGRVAWTGENVGVTSITGYGSAKFDRSGELDFSSVDFLREGFNYERRKSFSQEFRVQSVGDKRLNWIVGAVYAQDKHREGEFIAAGVQNDIGLPEDFPIELSHYNQKITSKALFAEATFDVTDALSLTAGARYSHDKIKRFEDQIEFGGPLQAVQGSRSFSDVSPRFVIKYKAADHVNLYASASKGWKSGGFELDPQRARSDFGAETLWNYEVGVKSTLLDNRLRANLALFYIDWNNVQVSSGVIGRDANGNIINYAGISNAASATSKGAELELLAAPTDQLELGLNIGYLKARFDKFADARTNFGTVDLSGKPLPKAPEWTLSTFAQYTVPLTGDFEAFVRGEYFYTDDAYTTVNNIAAVLTGQPRFPYEVKGYGKANLRIGVENDRFRIVGYVENLFDKKYYTASFDFGFANGAAVVPGLRRWGVRGSVKF
ncbi:TonB-dependent receptor [Rhizorhabdus wittichii]|uniref:TonB-dependent receptor n=2 Tax=Rhizorhabdus wittichii TaxID=160791 RepID=A0A9J9LGF4_RHIWR|nr:TonB-dependent receptor [Rhizorhabdus wittichii]ABQ71118.1 TonB-dependent receptor [Rhizorhabdus wittichii RW1]ARR52097.1 TonB-dependent receptor [Rhizorhabdus wittichii DC-6]QTH22194.1 TonB-dependent receptor [Rhizorhabdus wittichii]